MAESVVVALIQAPPVFLNLAASVARALELIHEAALSGARLIVFPETWLPGYPVWLDEAPGSALFGNPAAERLFQRLFDNAPAIDGPEVGELSRAAVHEGVDLVMGLHECDRGTLYNTSLFLGSEGDRQVHRKLTPTFNERLIWGQGAAARFKPGQGRMAQWVR